MQTRPPRDKRGVTMHEVAQYVGVSRATVSRIVNNRDAPISISEATRRRVLDAINELGYRPNRIAQSLMTNKTHIIGVSFPAYHAPPEPPDNWCDLPSYTLGRIIGGVQSITTQRNYDIQLMLRPEHNDDDSVPCTNSPLDFLDGMIYVTPNPRYDLYTPIYEAGVPMVLLGPNPTEHPISSIAGDNVGAIHALTRALVRRGHSRIALVLPGDETDLLSRLRKTGYAQALDEAGLPLDPALIVPNTHSPFTGPLDQHVAASITQHLLSLDRAPTALLVGHSAMVFGMVRELRRLELRCPEDIELVAYGDELGFDSLHPSITALDIRLSAQGARAADMLFEEIDGVVDPGRSIICPPLLRHRESCPLNGVFESPLTWNAREADQHATKEVISAHQNTEARFRI